MRNPRARARTQTVQTHVTGAHFHLCHGNIELFVIVFRCTLYCFQFGGPGTGQVQSHHLTYSLPTQEKVDYIFKSLKSLCGSLFD